MNASPLISIVTACYNAEEFIEHCIQSVVEQQYSSVEHLVIDGGSTDRTVEIIRRHEDKLTYWHSRPDRGIGHAFNLGLEHSSGEWLLFLNADDYFCRSDALTILAECASSSSAVDVIYGKVQPVSREANPTPVHKAVGWPYSPWRFLLRDLIPHPAAITSREYFNRVGAFSEDYRIIIDYELYLRSFRSLRTSFLPQVLTHMRVGGISQDSSATLNEMFKAHSRNHVLPAGARAILRSYVRSKVAVGRKARALLGKANADRATDPSRV